MAKYVVRRLLQAVPVVFLITLLCFMLMLMAPGGPQAQFNQNRFIKAAQVDMWLKHWCLVRNPGPVEMLKEYGGWLGVWNCQTESLFSEKGGLNFLPDTTVGLGPLQIPLNGGDNGMLHGDWGISIYLNQPVLSAILVRLPVTLLLMTTAWVIWVTLALLLGVIAAVKRYSVVDQVITLFSYIFYSLPTFWLGLMLISIFAVTLGWFPSQLIQGTRISPGPFASSVWWDAFWGNPMKYGYDVATHLVLPVTTLVAVSVAADSRFVRSAMLESLNQDYVRTARAKGLTERRVIFRHAFRNALLPIVTNVALEAAFLFSGAIVTETIFSLQGMGYLFYEGIQAHDYFLLMGIVLISSIMVVLFNLVADVLYAAADPRIRYD
jgi:peptide/nickel transport system permease protein